MSAQVMRLPKITIGIAVVAIVAAAIVYFVVIDRSYSSAASYANTGIEPDGPGSSVLAARPGRTTLVLMRGERESLYMTDSSWHEEVAVEIPTPAAGDQVDLAGPNVRIGYSKLQPFIGRWVIGDRGVRGYVQVHSVDRGGVTASYEIAVDAYSEKLLPEHRHREVVFRGRCNFASRSTPTDDRQWSSWPNPGK